MGRARVTRFDGAALADCLYLIGQAWVKLEAGDDAGMSEDLAAAERLAPPGAVKAVLCMIGSGELPAPGSDPAAMDTWLEACRMAGAGDLALIRIMLPSAAELAREEHEAFLRRLDQIAAAPGLPPAEPGPDLSKPGSA
jgi:hypothetical protein